MTSADAGSGLAGISDANSVGPTVSTSLWLTGGWVNAAPEFRAEAAAPEYRAESSIRAAAEYRDSLRLHQEQPAEPRRYGMVPASEVTHLRAEVARLTAIIETLRAAPEPAATPHPLLRAIRARPGNYGLAGLAH